MLKVTALALTLLNMSMLVLLKAGSDNVTRVHVVIILLHLFHSASGHMGLVSHEPDYF